MLALTIITMACQLLSNNDAYESQRAIPEVDAVVRMMEKEYHSTKACEKNAAKVMKIDHGTDWRVICTCGS